MPSMVNLFAFDVSSRLDPGSGRLATTLTLGLLLAALGLLFHRAVTHPLARVPGPFLAKFTGLWRTAHYFRGTWHDDILALHRRYGPVVRVAPDELSIVDAAATKQLYGHGGAAHAPKTHWYHTWEESDVAPAFFAARDRALHAFLRRRVAAAYAMTTLLKNETAIQNLLDLLFRRLSAHAAAGTPIDMSEYTNAFAYDVVGELAYGAPLGHLETGTDVLGLRKKIFDGFFLLANVGHFPGQSRLVNNRFVDAVARGFGLEHPLASFRRWSEARVDERLRDPVAREQRQDMLAHFVRMKTPDGEPAPRGEVLVEMLNIIAAGADTTSIAMRTILYHLCRHPGAYKKLQAALDAYHTTHNLTTPITYLQTQQIPYLVAVCKEAMRLLPSITYQLLRHAPSTGLEVAGFRIPAGTPVGVSPIAANRDPQVWGQDAEEFVPERWLRGDENQVRRFESALMTWGGNGPRMCVGKNLALIEIHKMIAQLLRRFDVGFVDPEKPWRITTYWFSYQHDMHMWIKAREGIPVPAAA